MNRVLTGLLVRGRYPGGVENANRWGATQRARQLIERDKSQCGRFASRLTKKDHTMSTKFRSKPYK